MRTGSLYIIQIFLQFLKAQAVSRRPVSMKARVQCQVSPCEIYGGQSGTGTGFSPSNKDFFPPPRSVSFHQCTILIFTYMRTFQNAMLFPISTSSGWKYFHFSLGFKALNYLQKEIEFVSFNTLLHVPALL